MPRIHSQKGSGRKPRLSSVLEHTLSDYFRTEMELPGLVSISYINVATNMQFATVWLSVYGADPDEIISALRSQSGDMRKYLTKRLVSKYIPKLAFKVDISADHADKIARKLKELE